MRFFQRFITVLVLFFSLAPSCFGDAVELPAVIPLTTESAVIDLHLGRIDIEIEYDAEPRAEITDLDRGDSTTGLALVSEENGAVKITQAYGDESIAPALALRVVVAPGQRLEIRGSDLVVNVLGPGSRRDDDQQDSAAVADAGAQSGGAAGKQPLLFDLDDSDVTIDSAGNLTLAGEATHYKLVACYGVVDSRLDSGEVVFREFSGRTNLRGDRTEYSVSDSGGSFVFQLESGSIDITSSSGDLRVDAREASIRIDQWHGAIDVKGEDNHVEVLSSGGEDATVVISGRESNLLAESIEGMLRLSAEGGQGSAKAIGGKTVAYGSDGAVVTLENLENAVDLRLESGASATVKKARGSVSARLEESLLDVQDAGRLDLRLNLSEATAQGIKGRLKAALRNSMLSADLARGADSRSQDLELKGDSEAKISLSGPCLVKVKQALEEVEHQITVGGCELVGRETRRSGNSRSSRLRAATMTALNVKISPTSLLEVDGK